MTYQSPRFTFDRRLHQLLDETLVLGSMAEQAVASAVDALYLHDLERSRQIYLEDQIINGKRYQLENTVIALIAGQQPMARDLRFLAAVLEIITELERIADYAKGISKINLLIGLESPLRVPDELKQMADLASAMLHRALTAFVEQDAVSARQIPTEDQQVDELYNQVVGEMLDVMLKNPSKIDRANYLVWAAHNLERMADRVTNICERILFMVTGEVRELDQNIGIQDWGATGIGQLNGAPH